MSENAKSQTSESESSMQREDWLVFLTGGLVSSGVIGWLVYKDFKSQQLDSKSIMTIAASFAGGMGIYLTGSALVYMWRKSNDSEGKSITSKNYASDLAALDRETSLCERFANVVNELERKFAFEARECEGFDKKTFTNNIQEAAEVPCKLEDMTKRLNDFNRKGPRNGLKLLTDNQMETCSNDGIGSQKARFREEILSYINELKGYVQGTIDPLPLARNIQFRSTEMSDEMRRQVVMIVKEYANSMLPKLEQVIDEFVDSVCKAVKVLDYDKEHKVKRAFETLGVSEKDLSTAPLKTEMNQYCNALENATKNKSQMPSCQNGQRSKNALGANMQPLESISNPSLHEKNTWVKTSECSPPVMPKLATPTSAGIPFMSKEADKPGHRAVKKLKNPHSAPSVKLFLSQEQMNYLNILKSEL
ncbi:hypothetical protein AVEN_10380-1 [Araneus ventricosus]|uniref:Uncharacterized protein n=1 Tax=Araneus ventricosus TaxID=182803 RepID=A0A4Y2GYW1_ARAVE|nr:hypothetical protein AVEN_10380-1 [Araneus ventricosus]